MSQLSAIVEPLLSWYQSVKRPLPWRDEPNPYHVWISEIMLQQTRTAAVIPYYRRFLLAFPTVFDLAEADDNVLLKAWEGLGYYRRAHNLKRAARLIVQKHGGCLPSEREELLALPGIGEYTAGAIASIAYGKPEPAVDGNVLRVLARLTEDSRNILLPAVRREAQEALRAVYPREPERARAFTEALMELGEQLCIPGGAPRCEECPLRDLCLAKREGLTESLPYREKRAARRIEERTVFLLLHGSRVGIFRREDEGLLGGLWEFPSAGSHLSPDEVRDYLASFGLSVLSVKEGPPAKHIFTHKEWHMRSYLVMLREEGGGITFAEPCELRRTYAIPHAFSAFLKFLEERQG